MQANTERSGEERRERDGPNWADGVLKASGVFWYLVAIPGQLYFAFYTAVYYGGSALRGDLSAWGEVMPHGIEPGDTAANVAISVHLAFVSVMIAAGAIQLVPQVRAVAPRVHHWSGRVFLLGATVLALSGLVLVATRGSALGAPGDVSISLNAALILVFATLALREAVARRIDSHRRWALRLFLAASGVWFFRVGLLFWLAVHQAPVGFDPERFRGPFLVFLGFAQYMLPLAVLHAYFAAGDGARAAPKLLVAALVVVLTLAMGFGVIAAVMGLWAPRLG